MVQHPKAEPMGKYLVHFNLVSTGNEDSGMPVEYIYEGEDEVDCRKRFRKEWDRRYKIRRIEPLKRGQIVRVMNKKVKI